jgi:hypothetical protein
MLQWAWRIWVGVQSLHRDLSPKVGNIKPMNCKRIKKELKACSFLIDLKKILIANHVRLNFFPNHQKFAYLLAL